jgi:hypothetical protein
LITASDDRIAEHARDVAARHRRALALVASTRLPFVVGGGYALRHYAADVRDTKDLDIFVHRRDALDLLDRLAAAGFETTLAFPHWLGKARIGSAHVDIIYSSGNGLAEVDDDWFTHSVRAAVLGLPVHLCPVEEMIWSKAFVMERERYDGADVSHLISACHRQIDWWRLVERFGDHWRVLLSHLTLFGFIYPGERTSVPAEVMRELGRRLEDESRRPEPVGRICRGTLLSREQYLTDVCHWGYADGRLWPHGSMTAADVAHWTAAIDAEEEPGNESRRRR